MDFEYIWQAWKELPRDWRVSLLCILAGGLYIGLQVWSIVFG